jgi:hypothetical protein
MYEEVNCLNNVDKLALFLREEMNCLSRVLIPVFVFQRLAIAKEFGDKQAERRAYSNLGNAHIFLGEFEVAAEKYR